MFIYHIVIRIGWRDPVATEKHSAESMLQVNIACLHKRPTDNIHVLFP